MEIICLSVCLRSKTSRFGVDKLLTTYTKDEMAFAINKSNLEYMPFDKATRCAAILKIAFNLKQNSLKHKVLSNYRIAVDNYKS